jgi:hypothetical protein
MISDETKPITMHPRLLLLSKQAGTVRDALVNERGKLPNTSMEELNNLETVLADLSKKMAVFETEHGNLLALAGIGQVVNSTLELDAVLQIVMDTIIRLTRAERGF